MKTSLDAGYSKESHNADTNTPLILKFMSKIHIGAFAVLIFDNFQRK